MFNQMRGQPFFHNKIKSGSPKKLLTTEKICLPTISDDPNQENSGVQTPHFKLRYI